MEGFLHLRLRPWLRRLVTRALAIAPAFAIVVLASQSDLLAASGSDGKPSLVDTRLVQLLVLSQAILSFQLPFAILPLVLFTSERRRMGEFASRIWLKALAWACAGIVVVLNGLMIYLQMQDWAKEIAEAGWSPLWMYGTIGPLSVLLAGFLVWVGCYPVRARSVQTAVEPPALDLSTVRYHRIGVAVEFEGGDDTVLTQAAALARLHDAQMVILHVVEGLGATYHGSASLDRESVSDRQRMQQMVQHLGEQNLSAKGVLGYGQPAEELIRIAQEEQLDLLVLGTHGHGFFADLALGRTVSPVLHRLTIPVLVVPARSRMGTYPSQTEN
jgi:manganese transport protein